jgi:hypothetical protein
MVRGGGVVRRAWLGVAFVALSFFALPAAANTWADTCANCHATNAGAGPPFMPSADATFGKIMAETGQFTDDCIATFNCILRQRLAGEDANGNIINANARANMLAFAQGAGSFSAAELDAVRLYLLKVRDDQVGSASPAFSFPNTLTTSNSTITSTIVVSNWRSLSVAYTFSITGAAAGDYAILSGGSGSCAASASATSSNNCNATPQIRFSPSAGGARNATLNLTFTAVAGNPTPFTRTFAITGTGVVPTAGFQISATTLNISTEIGTSNTGTLTITNPVSATANLTFSSFVFSAPQFVRSGASTCSTVSAVAIGGSCTLVVTFTPSGPGAAPATLTINHNAPGTPQLVTLNGTGTRPVISPTTNPIAFPNTQLGVTTAPPQHIVVTNTGDAPLVFSVEPGTLAARSGPNSGDFAVVSTCHIASPLPPAGTCTLDITFTPTALGARSDTVTVTSDAVNGPLVIALSGTGVALPEPTVTFPPTDFPDTVIGETSAQTRTITILNTRTRNITYSIAGTADFTIGAESCGAGRTVLGGGGTCTITIQFTPQLGAGEGHRQTTLTLTFAGTGGDVAPGNQSGNVGGNALLPLSPSTASLNLSAVVGSPTTTAMLLTNRAATPITLSSLVFGGVNPGDYSIDASSVCVPALVLAPSSACSLVIRFNPPTAGTRNATLTITHSALGSPQSVALQGTATPAPQGQIQLSSTLLAYADTQLGSTSAQSVTVRNSGNLALTFSAFTFGGAMPGDFQRSGSCDTSAPLAIGAQCTLTVTFGPTALGLRTATLTIASDASNGAATIALSGNGVPVPAPQVSLNPTTLDFGTQTRGGIYPSRRVRLSNSGTAVLAISSIVVAGTGFVDVSAGPCPATLAPGAGCDIDIAFAATAAQSYSGTLTVTSNAPGSPNVTVLEGVGSASALAVLVWSPAVTQIDFGAVSAGSVSAIQSATLLNQGPGGVNLTVLNAIGADGASFAVIGGTCAIGVPLFQGDTCRVDFAFAPGSSGNKTATVQVASTGSFPPALSLIGVGLAGPNPSLAMSASALAFESIRVGAQSLPQDVRLTSSGSGLVGIQSIDVTGPYAIQSTTCPIAPFSLQPGAECTISVSFRPNAEGASTGTLHITTDAAPVDRIVSLSGSAEAEPNLSNGGCSIAGGATLLDPTLWLLALLAAIVLVQRQRRVCPRPGRERDGDKR